MTAKPKLAGLPCWVDLMTSDAEGARKFYAALFGWTYETEGPDTNHYSMCKKSGQNAAGLGPQPPNMQSPPAWSLYFRVDDADKAAAAIKEQGGQVVMGPMTVMEEGRMAIASDPTGAFFGLWQPKRHNGFEVESQHGGYAWTEVLTRDVARAKDFYSKLFGLEPHRLDAPDMEYYTLHKGSEIAGGIMQLSEQFPPSVPPHWAVYFAVDDTDAAVAKITELGGSIKAPAFDTPYGRIAVVADPQGAVFSIIKLAPAA
jgi:hypothetical protein